MRYDKITISCDKIKVSESFMPEFASLEFCGVKLGSMKHSDLKNLQLSIGKYLEKYERRELARL